MVHHDKIKPVRLCSTYLKIVGHRYKDQLHDKNCYYISYVHAHLLISYRKFLSVMLDKGQKCY